MYRWRRWISHCKIGEALIQNHERFTCILRNLLPRPNFRQTHYFKRSLAGTSLAYPCCCGSIAGFSNQNDWQLPTTQGICRVQRKSRLWVVIHGSHWPLHDLKCTDIDNYYHVCRRAVLYDIFKHNNIEFSRIWGVCIQHQCLLGTHLLLPAGLRGLVDIQNKERDNLQAILDGCEWSSAYHFG